MLIYKVVNKVDGKIYIGQTVGNLNRRKSEHLNDAKVGRYDSYFHNALRKHGKDNFGTIHAKRGSIQITL